MAATDGDKIQDYDPLSGTTRRVKRNLLAVSTLALLFDFGVIKLDGKAIGLSGVSFSQQYLPSVFLLVIIYLSVSLWFHWKDDDSNRSYPANWEKIKKEKSGDFSFRFQSKINDRINIRLRQFMGVTTLEELQQLPDGTVNRVVGIIAHQIYKVFEQFKSDVEPDVAFTRVQEMLQMDASNQDFNLARKIPAEIYPSLLKGLNRLAQQNRIRQDKIQTFSYSNFRRNKLMFELGLPYSVAGAAILMLAITWLK